MFGLFHKKEQKALELGAPVSGQAVPLQEVSDPTFGGEILGKGVAVRPTDGRIYAPADGEITLVFDTLHALSMTTDTGAELLLHIGLDTVALKLSLIHILEKESYHVSTIKLVKRLCRY